MGWILNRPTPTVLGKVVAVYNDGDKGVYRHDASAEEVEEKTEACQENGNTPCGGERMGETKYWDEFRAHDNQTGEVLDKVQAGARIHFGESWVPTLRELHQKAAGMSLREIARESTRGGKFDVKSNPEYAPNGTGTGKLLNGKYASARSAGNYLAGANARQGTQAEMSISKTTYMKMAGALHQGEWSRTTALKILTYGASYGPPPYYGEIPYARRMTSAGWDNGF